MSKIFITLAVAASLNTGSAFGDNKTQHLNSGTVIPKGLPVSDVVVANDTIYVSGMIGIKPLTIDVVKGGIEVETRQTLNNIKTMLEANDYDLGNLVKCTVFLSDLSEYRAFNTAYTEFFKEVKFPARTVIGGTKLVASAKIEVDCIGAK